MGMLRAIGHSLRLARAGIVMARESVFNDVDPQLAPPVARPALALARLISRNRSGGIAVAVARLGPSYVKLGQFLATRADIVGPNVVRELEKLQDKMAPFPMAEARAAIETAFGRPLETIYTRFDPPLAAASMAQVHRAAIIENGVERDVAVKVQRPHVGRRFRRDLGDMFFAARIAERNSAEARRLKLVEVVETLARSVTMEMDFRLEAAAASEFRENVGSDTDIIIPRVDWDRTAANVMTLEWMQGIPLSDEAALAASGHDLPALGRTVVQTFLRHALRDGFFHADMHPGNLFVTPDGRLGAVDFGIMGRLGRKERRFLAEILLGFITRDYHRVAEVHFEAGYVPKHHRVEDFAQAIRAIGEPIHSRRADEISMAKLLTLLFEITALFDMKTRTELVMLQKTMVVVEGVARRLDPRLDIWSAADPVVRGWIERNLGPKGRIEDAWRGLQALGHAAAQAPEFFERFKHIVDQIDDAREGGLSLSDRSVDSIGRAEAYSNRWGVRALWVIAALLAVIVIAG